MSVTSDQRQAAVAAVERANEAQDIFTTAIANGDEISSTISNIAKAEIAVARAIPM